MVLLQILPLEAERSFGRCFLSAKESKENAACMFVGVSILQLCRTTVNGSASLQLLEALQYMRAMLLC